MDIYGIIKKPLITEKSTNLIKTDNRVTFKVALNANKDEIKKVVETIFNVTVLRVNTLRMKGKKKRVGRNVGKRPDWKKAIVTLKKGDRIEIFEGV
ncbi:MAG: 50S ribosomal protein L23 [Nitrospinae bacterium]|nr:50S ribosomal protein L23 [Nitrospinota bacterium]